MASFAFETKRLIAASMVIHDFIIRENEIVDQEFRLYEVEEDYMISDEDQSCH